MAGGRTRGTKANWVPDYPKHPHSSVTLVGRYGKSKDRQRYRCTPAGGEPTHKFAGTTARLVAPEHICERC